MLTKPIIYTNTDLLDWLTFKSLQKIHWRLTQNARRLSQENAIENNVCTMLTTIFKSPVADSIKSAEYKNKLSRQSYIL